MIVLDTHALIWLMDGDDQLGRLARDRIEDARNAEGVFVAAITPWEISMLVDKQRIHLAMAVDEWMDFVFKAEGIWIAPLEPAIGVDAGRLSGGIHGDPADRIVIATARAMGCPLLTSDRKILNYGKQGYVSVIDANK
jgi:PIN domain nuclease of toxin-antitoxin system